MQFFFKIIKNRFSRFWKYLNIAWSLPEQPVELTQKYATQTKTPHSWYSYFVTIVGHYYDVIIEGL